MMKSHLFLLGFALLAPKDAEAQTLVNNGDKIQWDQVAASLTEAQNFHYELYVNEGKTNETVYKLTGVTCVKGSTSTSFTCNTLVPVLQVGIHSLTMKTVRASSVPSVPLVVERIVVDPRCAFPSGSHWISIFPTRLTNAGSKANIAFQLASPGAPITRLSVRLNGVDVKTLTGDNLTDTGSIWFDRPTISGKYQVSMRAVNAIGCTSVISTIYSVFVQ